MAYTLTRRHDNVVLETGVEGYLTALQAVEKYPNIDVIIHPDNTDWMAEKNRTQNHDAVQAAWAYL